MRVLVVEDARRLADAIARGLRAEGMAVDVAYDGLEGHQKSTITRYDVVVLDRDLPEMHGDDLLAEIVAAGDLTRVLMLTAAAGVDDRVDGLSLGADDYLSKPFAFPELVARVRALGRRATPAAPPVLRAGDLELDSARRTVTRAGRPIELTRKEFGVLEVLLAAARLRGVQRGPAGAGLGRERRPVHHDRAGDDDDVAPQARRARADRHRRRGRVPGRDCMTPAAIR